MRDKALLSEIDVRDVYWQVHLKNMKIIPKYIYTYIIYISTPLSLETKMGIQLSCWLCKKNSDVPKADTVISAHGSSIPTCHQTDNASQTPNPN